MESMLVLAMTPQQLLSASTEQKKSFKITASVIAAFQGYVLRLLDGNQGKMARRAWLLQIRCQENYN